MSDMPEKLIQEQDAFYVLVNQKQNMDVKNIDFGACNDNFNDKRSGDRNQNAEALRNTRTAQEGARNPDNLHNTTETHSQNENSSVTARTPERRNLCEPTIVNIGGPLSP